MLKGVLKISDKVLLTKDAFKKLIKDLIYIEENKNLLIDDYFLKSAPQKFEINQVITSYILQVDNLIKKIEVSQDAKNEIPFVLIGSKVYLQDLDKKQSTILTIVMPLQEAEGYYASFISPIGSSLLLKRVGEEITINTPNGVVHYKIISVTLPFP